MVREVGPELNIPTGNPLHPAADGNSKGRAESPRSDVGATLEVGRYAEATVHERHDAPVAPLPREIDVDADIPEVDGPRGISLHHPRVRRAARVDDSPRGGDVLEPRRQQCGPTQSQIVAQPERRAASRRDSRLVGAR